MADTIKIAVCDDEKNIRFHLEINKGVRYYTATPEMIAAYATMELRADL